MSETTTSEAPQVSVSMRFANTIGNWWQDRMPKAVEDEWIVAHQKIVDQLGSDKAREFFLKLKNVFRLLEKQGISSLVIDGVTAGLIGGLIATTIPNQTQEMNQAGLDVFTGQVARTTRRDTMRLFYRRQKAPWAIAGALSVLALGPTRQLNRFAAKMAGDHVGAIVNRIVGSPL